MQEVDIKNLEIINSLVRQHFSLDYESKEKFSSAIRDRAEYIPEEVVDFLGEDQRLRIDVPESQKFNFDDGWRIFNEVFKDFIDEYSITYENFLDNKVEVDGQSMKIFKLLKKWVYSQTESMIEYLKSEGEKVLDVYQIHTTEQLIKGVTEKIGARKLPNKNLQMVMSCNFADWFMASTAEKWSSCLNMESDYEGAYWSGLPGLITDKNRIMIYVTDGTKKEYEGIVVDRFLSRFWNLVSKNGYLVPVKQYPQKFFDYSKIGEFFKDINFCSANVEDFFAFESKYPLTNLLFNKQGQSVFIYQDHTTFSENDDGKIIFKRSPNSGYHKVDNNFGQIQRNCDNGYFFESGLRHLIANGEEINDYDDEGCFCNNCGDRFDPEDTLTGADSNIYCEDCYDYMFCNCETCGDSVYRSEACVNDCGYTYCEDCYNEEYTFCEKCDCEVEIRDSKVIDDMIVCEYCYDIIKEEQEQEEEEEVVA